MFDLEKFKTGKYFVHLQTQELYEEAMEFLEENKFSTLERIRWNAHGNETCIRCDEYDRLNYSDREYYESEGYELLELNTEKTKLKVGDKVRIKTDRIDTEIMKQGDIGYVQGYTNLPEYPYIVVKDKRLASVTNRFLNFNKYDVFADEELEKLHSHEEAKEQLGLGVGVVEEQLGLGASVTKEQVLPIRKTKLKIGDDELEKLHSRAEVNAQLGLVRTLPMGKRSNEERYTELMLENKEIYLDKNKKYGDAFAETIQKYGYISAITRMNDKFNRIEQFTIEGFEDEEESLRDSLMDLANYCYMYVMELDNE